MTRPVDEVWDEPVRAEDVLDGYELREYHAARAERAGYRPFTTRGLPLAFPDLAPAGNGEREDAEGYAW